MRGHHLSPSDQSPRRQVFKRKRFDNVDRMQVCGAAGLLQDFFAALQERLSKTPDKEPDFFQRALFRAVTASIQTMRKAVAGREEALTPEVKKVLSAVKIVRGALDEMKALLRDEIDNTMSLSVAFDDAEHQMDEIKGAFGFI